MHGSCSIKFGEILRNAIERDKQLLFYAVLYFTSSNLVFKNEIICPHLPIQLTFCLHNASFSLLFSFTFLRPDFVHLVQIPFLSFVHSSGMNCHYILSLQSKCLWNLTFFSYHSGSI